MCRRQRAQTVHSYRINHQQIVWNGRLSQAHLLGLSSSCSQPTQLPSTSGTKSFTMHSRTVSSFRYARRASVRSTSPSCNVQFSFIVCLKRKKSNGPYSPQVFGVTVQQPLVDVKSHPPSRMSVHSWSKHPQRSQSASGFRTRRLL